MRKISKLELSCLIHADRHGEFAPTSKATIDACNVLVGHSLMGEHDGAPGRYWITDDGERYLMKQLALVK